jgi:hypothetical protein
MNNQMIRELTENEIAQVSGAEFAITLSSAFAPSASAFLNFGDFQSEIGGGFQTAGQVGLTLPSLTDLLGDLF